MLAETPRVHRITDVAVLLAALLGSAAGAQTPGANPVQLAQATAKVDSAKHHDASAFSESQDPIEVTLTTNIGRIRGDKKEDAQWGPAALSYKAPDGNLVKPRWGYRRLYMLLKREGCKRNRKLVQRLYREEGLSVRRRKRRKMAAVARSPMTCPLGPSGASTSCATRLPTAGCSAALPW